MMNEVDFAHLIFIKTLLIHSSISLFHIYRLHIPIFTLLNPILHLTQSHFYFTHCLIHYTQL